jgi:flagellar hook-basal body complex protein FliE
MINKVNNGFSQAIQNAAKSNSISKTNKANQQLSKTAKTAGEYLNEVDKQQVNADISVKQMLAGNEDISSVIAKTAKADMSFKLLVGVRNKLVEAYKQTMNMKV